MEKNRVNLPLRLCTFGLYVCFAAIFLVHCDAKITNHRYRHRKYFRNSNTRIPRKFHASRKYDIDMPLDASNSGPYVSSPLSLPPYESLPPYPLSQNAPPYCIYPPSTPLPPSTIPSPTTGGGYTPSPPPASTLPSPSPPTNVPSPTEPVFSPPYYEPSPSPPTNVPSPTEPVLSPPYYEPSPPSGEVPSPPTNVPSPTEPVFSPPYYEPSPPSGGVPSPPYNIPSPSGSIPSPRFLPPVVYPPPTVPPPPRRTPTSAMWCVAKPSVPEPIIQEAMNYACGSGADCDQIQPNGSCFEPNSIISHASYAFNSFWQRTKVGGGTCDFGGTAILVTVDPSYDGCHFIYV